ncbi:MAG TPA: hypothetical protein VKJ47_07280 [Candidatus Binatia bacterium]|nr:hypothetical protein [Candidatus Binatia bacterium]
MTYAALLNMLRHQPRSFLRDHYLKITVLPTEVFGQAQYYFGAQHDDPPQQPMRWGVGPRTRGSKILNFVPLSYRGQLAPGDGNVPPTNIAPTNVLVVPTDFADTVPNFAAMNGNHMHHGPHIMITALLNGCTFCCANHPGGGVLMKHIRPRGALDHEVLAQRIGATGAFVNQVNGTFRFFGSGGHGYDAFTNDVTIVGVRRGGNWAVYAQVHTKGVFDILRVTRIFPPD